MEHCVLQENFKRLMELTTNAQSAYMEMISMLEKDGGQSGGGGGQAGGTGASNASVPFPLFHYGHSRTPSACSAISFTSSILSEPISENYPHSEPETDSRGYEIVRSAAVNPSGAGVGGGAVGGAQHDDGGSEARSESTASSSVSHQAGDGKVTVVESLDYEADTEEDCVRRRRKKSSSGSPARAEVSLNGFHDDGNDTAVECVDDDDDEDEDESKEAGGEDTVQDLPHIDSIHSSVVDLSAEILSQHSSKTLDQNAEVMSQHSSKTLEGGAGGGGTGGRVTPDRSSATRGGGGMGSAPDLRDSCSGGGGGSTTPRDSQKKMDKERIESWVAETQKQISMNGITPSASDVEEVNEEEIEEDADEQDKDAGLDFSQSPALCEKISSPAADSNSNNLATLSTTDTGLIDVAR